VKPLSASKQRVKSFEELHIFQSARKLCGDVWDFTRTVPAAKDFAFTTQIRRSPYRFFPTLPKASNETPGKNSSNSFP
jgi:23S rRNA-intervening sequence protein